MLQRGLSPGSTTTWACDLSTMSTPSPTPWPDCPEARVTAPVPHTALEALKSEAHKRSASPRPRTDTSWRL